MSNAVVFLHPSWRADLEKMTGASPAHGDKLRVGSAGSILEFVFVDMATTSAAPIVRPTPLKNADRMAQLRKRTGQDWRGRR